MLIAAAPVLPQLLYGLGLFDVIAYVEVVGILTSAVGLATWIPARRAVRVDAAITLKSD
jgi:hypothetical protein